MADEISLNVTLQVKNGNIDFVSRPNSFKITMTGTKGERPGELTVPTTGKVVDLSTLTTPGACFIHNRDATNFVTMGVYDGSRFFPLLKFPPGIGYPVYLSNYLNQEFVGTGTGTNADVNRLMLIANTATCQVLVTAFDS